MDVSRLTSAHSECYDASVLRLTKAIAALLMAVVLLVLVLPSVDLEPTTFRGVQAEQVLVATFITAAHTTIFLLNPHVFFTLNRWFEGSPKALADLLRLNCSLLC